MTSAISAELLRSKITENLDFEFGVTPAKATNRQIYETLSKVIVSILKNKRHNFTNANNSTGRKIVYYLSVEFLMGRSLKSNIFNLGMDSVVESVVKDLCGTKINRIYEEEPDAGLGNGGLGRLAACYLDSLATREYPAVGYSILYEYGIFKQKLEEGWQKELADDWLPGGGVWLQEAKDKAIEVHFDGFVNERWDGGNFIATHENYRSVIAVPYDMFIAGYDSKGVSKLRLWKAVNTSFDMNTFNKGEFAAALGSNDIAATLTKVLYPNDNFADGKALRLRQEYFMCAASIGDIVLHHINLYGTLDNLHEKCAIHINDTHPTLAIPELMRILLDDCGYSWAKAWHIVQNTFAYTNHTVMPEALETWDTDMMQKILPRIFSVICEINRRYCEGLFNRLGDNDKVSKLSIVQGNKVHMANLCVDAAHSINGVSWLHSEIIKERVFRGQYEDKPIKFKNVTNGIAYRRWLLASNKGLTNLLSETIGEGFKKNGEELSRLRVFENNLDVLNKLADIKLANKERLGKVILKRNGIVINPNSIFDVQVKRLHEYKRQQLNALNIISEYNFLRENPNADFVPKTYIFASKAAPGYYMAKQIIKLIWCLQEELRKDKKLSEKLQVVFLEDYNVSLSEVLMPAAEISEQISLAGTEASGTGNMKLMLNGALTLGTYDGANVEIHGKVGDENIFIFGMRANEADLLKANGYRPEQYYNSNGAIRAAISLLERGLNGSEFSEIANSLKTKDQYMSFADFESYREAQRRVSETYRDKTKWNNMSLVNIAEAGFFSADRSVEEYAHNIWNLD